MAKIRLVMAVSRTKNLSRVCAVFIQTYFIIYRLQVRLWPLSQYQAQACRWNYRFQGGDNCHGFYSAGIYRGLVRQCQSIIISELLTFHCIYGRPAKDHLIFLVLLQAVLLLYFVSEVEGCSKSSTATCEVCTCARGRVVHLLRCRAYWKRQGSCSKSEVSRWKCGTLKHEGKLYNFDLNACFTQKRSWNDADIECVWSSYWWRMHVSWTALHRASETV